MPCYRKDNLAMHPIHVYRLFHLIWYL